MGLRQGGGTISQYLLEKWLRFTAELLEMVSPTDPGRWRIPPDTSNQAPDCDDDSDDDDDDDSDGYDVFFFKNIFFVGI